MEDTDNPYTILGVPKEATQQQIKSAYRKLALKHHPDKQSTEEGKKEATVVFAKISNAYEILGDPAQRQNYDREVNAKINRPRSKQPRHTQSPAEFFHHTQFHDPFSVFEAVFREEFGGDFFGGLHQRRGNPQQPHQGPFGDPFFGGSVFGNDPFFGGGGGGGGMMGRDPFFGGGMGMGGSPFGASPFGASPFGGSMFAKMDQQMNQMMNMHQTMMAHGGQPQLQNQGTFVYSSTSSANLGGGGGQRVTNSTTTRVVNGRRQTVTERIVHNPDGTVERHVDLTGDEGFPSQQRQLPAGNPARPALEGSRQDSSRRRSSNKKSSRSSNRHAPPKDTEEPSSKGKSMKSLFKRKRRDSSRLEP